MPPYSFFPRRGNLALRIGASFCFEMPEPEAITEEMIAEKANFIMGQIDALR
jgi:hypothetical protein